VGFAVFILHNFGLLPNNFLTQNSSKLGVGRKFFFPFDVQFNKKLEKKKNELNRLL
jgi:hypothetical protein